MTYLSKILALIGMIMIVGAAGTTDYMTAAGLQTTQVFGQAVLGLICLLPYHFSHKG